MKKHISIIATAIITGSIAMAGAMSSFAAEDIAPEMPATTNNCTEMAQFETETVSVEGVQFKADEVQTPTEAPTEAPTQATTEAPVQVTTEAPAQAPAQAQQPLADKQIAGTWSYWRVDDAGIEIKDAKENGSVVIKEDGTFTYTSGGNTVSGLAFTEHVIIAGDDYISLTLSADNFSFTGQLDHWGEISIGAGASAKLTRSSAPAAVTTTTAKAQVTTTAAATKAANKNSSPKTGVAFPVIPVAGLAVASVAVAFTLRKKKED